MEILIVGAGAVGRVYARHLQDAGARVSLYVRPARTEEARSGYVLHRIRSRWWRTTMTFRPDEVLSSTDEVASRRFDQVWLCVPADALEALDPLLSVLGDAALVSLVPGTAVRGHLERFVPAERLVIGEIGFLSYATPLEGSKALYEQKTPPGTAYFFAPLGSQFGGAHHQAKTVAAWLRKGGCPARYDSNAELNLLYSSAFILPFVAGLELSDWDFATFRDRDLALALRASREAIDAISKREHRPKPAWYPFLAAPSLFGLASRLARYFTPFDVETFFHVHFGKLPGQTSRVVRGYREVACSWGIPAAALEELSTRLSEKRRE